MRVRGTLIVWIVVLILESVHTEARGGSMDEEVRQRGRKPKRPKPKAGEESDYVTDEEFANAINILQAEMNSLAVQVGGLQDDLDAIKNSDYCANNPNPCVNEGECQSKLNGYYCICKASYGGVNCEHVYGPVITATLRVDNGNTEGEWNFWEMCPTGSFAHNFRIKLEDDLGSKGDDTAMNNVEMTCVSASTGNDVGTIKSGYGPFGTWRGWQGFPTFLVAFRLRVEPDQGGSYDDSAVNAITMISEDGTAKTGISNFEGEFGSTVRCPENSYICGVATRIEGPQPGDGDDSSLNDVMMRCCAW